MPLPVHAQFWLPADVRSAARDFDAQLGGFLSSEHKDDGSHGDITADSLTATGAVSAADATFSTVTVTTLNGLTAKGITVQDANGNEMFSVSGQDLLFTNTGGNHNLILGKNGALNGTKSAGTVASIIKIGASDTVDIDPSALGVTVGGTLKASGLPTSAGAAGTLWVDGSGFVKRA